MPGQPATSGTAVGELQETGGRIWLWTGSRWVPADLDVVRGVAAPEALLVGLEQDAPPDGDTGTGTDNRTEG